MGNLSHDLIKADQFEQAENYARKMLELSPGNPNGLAVLASALLAQGRPQEALAYVERIPGGRDDDFSAGDRDRLMLMALAQSALGEDELASAALERFSSEYGDEYPVEVAYIHAWRGEADAAFEWLDRALTVYPDLEISVTWEPWLNRLKLDPRWTDLIARWPPPAPTPFL